MGGNAADVPDTKGKATKAATTDAAEVSKLDHNKDGGSQQAYAKLQEDFQKHTQGMSTDDKNTYWKTMNDALKANGTLPDLAVAWGQDSLNKGTYGDGNKLTKSDLNTIDTMGSRSNDAQSQMDGAFAKSLKDQMPNLSRNVWNDPITEADFTHSSIDKYQLNRAFGDQTKQNQQDHQQEMNRDAMAPLMANDGKLFKSLDGAAGKVDGLTGKLNDLGQGAGRFSPADAKAWLNNADNQRKLNGSIPEHGDGQGNPVVNQDNYNYVKSLADGTLKDSDGKPVLQSESAGNTVFNTSMQDLAKLGGFQGKNGDVEGAIANYNGKHAGDAGAGTVTTGAAADGSTTTTDSNGNTIKHQATADGSGDQYTVTSKDGTKAVGVTTKNMDDGDGGTYAQPTDVKTPDGGHYTYDADKGKWSAAADSKDGAAGGKSDFGFDSTTGTLTYKGGDGKNYSEAADGTTKEVPKAGSNVTHDANGADVTRDTNGNVTDIKYPADSTGTSATNHFDYDASGKMTGFIDANGKHYTSTDGKTFKAPDGTTDTNVSVDKDTGTIHYTGKDGKHMKVGTDGVYKADDNPPNPTAGADDPAKQAAAEAAKQELIKEGTQASGEGPYQVAQRILGAGASQADLNALTKAMKQSWQEKHGDAQHQNDKMTGLKAGEHFITPENIQALMDKVPGLKAKYDGLTNPSEHHTHTRTPDERVRDVPKVERLKKNIQLAQTQTDPESSDV